MGWAAGAANSSLGPPRGISYRLGGRKLILQSQVNSLTRRMPVAHEPFTVASTDVVEIR
jgi:hypothetical protein